MNTWESKEKYCSEMISSTTVEDMTNPDDYTEHVYGACFFIYVVRYFPFKQIC